MTIFHILKFSKLARNGLTLVVWHPGCASPLPDIFLNFSPVFSTKRAVFDNIRISTIWGHDALGHFWPPQKLDPNNDSLTPENLLANFPENIGNIPKFINKLFRKFAGTGPIIKILRNQYELNNSTDRSI